MTMPRLSLYRPEKGNNYKFIDKAVWQMFQVGGTDVLVHKYLGPGASIQGDTPSTPSYSSTNPTQIQDMLFLENRDRKYDPDVYVLRGVYNLQDTDFNLSQFGLFLQNDTVFITFHINDTVEKVGRKIIAGDVVELPHLKDDFALNDLQFALKRFYVIEEVNRAAEGFSATWYPHLYRAKCKPLVDSQEFKDILDGLADEDTDVTLRDIMSSYEKEMQITQAVLDQAEADAPKSGYDTSQLYNIRSNTAGLSEKWSSVKTYFKGDIVTFGENKYEVVQEATNVQPPNSSYYKFIEAIRELDSLIGYLTDDAAPPNGAVYSSGIAFPLSPVVDQYHLRTDYMPRRLFKYNGTRWVKVEDEKRMTMSNLGGTDVGVGDRFEGKDNRQTQKTSFINNDGETGQGALTFDVFYPDVDTNTIQTSLVFSSGMYAEVFLDERKTSATVSSGAGGLALITLDQLAATSTRVQFRLYAQSIKQKQSLSKALRPQAD